MNRLLLFLFTFFVSMQNTIAQTVIPLYPGVIPNNKPHADEERSERGSDGILRISKVSRPSISMFPASKEKHTRAAVIICPGGGYSIESAAAEGSDVAKVFNNMGITAFVLKYRIPDDSTQEDKSIAPLQDAQQAIKLVRENAKKWNIDPKRIGVMGFSAGGHLAASLGTHYTSPLIPNDKNTSLRPDFMILVYPVISFTDAIGHIGSREQLLGKDPSIEQINNYSNELHVNDSTPPTILIHSAGDNVVKVANSISFFDELNKHKVHAEMHIYQNGGHGYGLYIPGSKERWMDRVYSWMESNGWLKK